MNEKNIITKILFLHPTLKIIKFCEKPYIIVEDEYGKCKIQIHSLLSGSKPSNSTAIDKTEYFKCKLKKISPNLNIISIYKNIHSKIKVNTKYGICLCLPSNLLNGQIPLITTAINKTNYFIKQSKEIHNNKYDYSLVNYKNSKTKVKIVCKIHGVFDQMPQGHLINNGCKKCGDNDKTGWWYKNPINAKKLSNIYILQFKNNNETFIKIGITTNINKRINNLKNQCNNKYKITLLKKITNNVNYCYNLEKRFKKKIKENNRTYLPIINFCGKTECFI